VIKGHLKEGEKKRRRREEKALFIIE